MEQRALFIFEEEDTEEISGSTMSGPKIGDLSPIDHTLLNSRVDTWKQG